MGGTKGFLALVLHAHLPFVRHPEHEEFLEEEWLFEAITETYIPLLTLFSGLKKDHIPFRLTLTLSPPLVAMLQDDLLKERYLRHLDRLIDLMAREVERTAGDSQMHDLALMYQWRFTTARSFYSEQCRCDLVAAFARYEDEGFIEIITSGATHGFFPLLARNESAVRAQVAVARRSHERALGRSPQGIWLPECGYYSGVESILRHEGIAYTFLDAHGILHANPRPRYGVYAPVRSGNGVTFFGRDLESSRQVWSAKSGYPGNPLYRDFYRDIGFDRESDYLAPHHLQPTGQRKMSGIKYHRITGGEGVEKDIYNYSAALQRVTEDADDFVARRIERFEQLATLMDRPPLVVAPFDAELFGHWWFEGPEFLNALFRAIHRRADVIETLTPRDYLRRYPNNQTTDVADSSWGVEGYATVWLDKSNDWIYPLLDGAAKKMSAMAMRYGSENGLRTRALNQAARELLLAQSSDWPFIMKTGTVVSYATRRVNDHLNRFDTLHQMITTDTVDESELVQIEWLDPLFEQIDYRIFSD